MCGDGEDTWTMNEPRGDSWQLNAVRHSDVAAPEQQQRQHTNYNRVRVVEVVGQWSGYWVHDEYQAMLR